MAEADAYADADPVLPLPPAPAAPVPDPLPVVIPAVEPAPVAPAPVACVAGVNGEKSVNAGEKWVLGASPSPPSPAFLLPFPLPVYACYAGYGSCGCSRGTFSFLCLVLCYVLDFRGAG